MTRLLTALLCLLLATPAAAQTWTLEGTGPLPTLKAITPGTPPVVVPPVVPPPPPPVDTTPFVFPMQPPPDNHDDRRYIGGLCPGDDPCYASLDVYSSPLPYSHAMACILPSGMSFHGTPLGGTRLWVPLAWATAAPQKIRTLCAGGAL